jgi:hypothetical protein
MSQKGSGVVVPLSIIALIPIVAVIIYLIQKQPPQVQTTSRIAVPFQNLEIDHDCFPFVLYVTIQNVEGSRARENPPIAEEFVINSQNDYQKLLKYRRPSCPQATLPTVDFENYTLLGRYAEGTCATTGFSRKVVRDDITKTYTYTVEPQNSPVACMGPGLQDMNWITISKIPAGFSVKFLP